MSADPIGLEGGINLYGYVGADPVNWFDIDGLARGITRVYKDPNRRTPENIIKDAQDWLNQHPIDPNWPIDWPEPLEPFDLSEYNKCLIVCLADELTLTALGELIAQGIRLYVVSTGVGGGAILAYDAITGSLTSFAIAGNINKCVCECDKKFFGF